GRQGNARGDAAAAAVAQADLHAAGVAALGDVPVAGLRVRPGLEGHAAAGERSLVAAHLVDAVVLAAERRAGPAIAAVDHRVPRPGGQGATAAVRPVGGAVAEALGEHDTIRRPVRHGHVNVLRAARLEDHDVGGVVGAAEVVP